MGWTFKEALLGFQLDELKHTVNQNRIFGGFCFQFSAAITSNGSLYSKMDFRFELGMVENKGFDSSHTKIKNIKIGGFGRVLIRRSLPPPPGGALMRSLTFLKHVYNGVSIF